MSVSAERKGVLTCIVPASQPIAESKLDADRLYLVCNIPTGNVPMCGDLLPAETAWSLQALGYSPSVNFALLEYDGTVLFCGNVRETAAEKFAPRDAA